jgi:hypothetical protein
VRGRARCHRFPRERPPGAVPSWYAAWWLLLPSISGFRQSMPATASSYGR